MAARVTPIQTNFNAGEIARRARGRLDQAFYGNALDRMVGWLPLTEGPAITAPGSFYVAPAKGPCRLIPFEFNVTQSYLIEASALTMRFYTNNARIETGPGTAYEIVSPYSIDDVRELDYEQSADVLYLAHGDHQPRKLSRLTAETFAIDALSFRGGPFESNSDETIDVTPSGLTGTITLTASAPIFAAGDVGGLFQLEPRDFGNTVAWEAGMSCFAGTFVAWNGRVYEAISSFGKTGTLAPIHSEGDAWDGLGAQDVNGKGPYGVRWRFVHGASGYGRITAVSDAYHATLAVIEPLPFIQGEIDVPVNTWRWGFGEFSNRRGWPSAVAIWNERLCFLKGSVVYGSVVGDYENFAAKDKTGAVTADMAFKITLANPNLGRWLVPDKQLIVGTARAEHVVGAASSNSAVGPTNIKAPSESTFGSASIKPVLTDGRTLFVQKGKRKLIQLDYTVDRDRQQGINLSRFAQHISNVGIEELAFAQEPERHIWARLSDGRLAAALYDPGQQALGWATRPLADGLTAVSIARATDPAGEQDQIWIAAQVAGGGHVVLRMAPIWQEGDDQARVMMVDAGLMYDGAPVAAVGGLQHLVGRQVDVLVDGSYIGRKTVAGDGSITLGVTGSVVVAGLPYEAWFRTLPPSIGGPDGASQGKIKRIPALTVRLAEALGLRFTVQGGDSIVLETRVDGAPTDEAPPLFTGDRRLEAVGDYERDGQITIERIAPVPATVLALLAEMEVSER
jgi:hypothetical protein